MRNRKREERSIQIAKVAGATGNGCCPIKRGVCGDVLVPEQRGPLPRIQHKERWACRRHHQPWHDDQN